MNHSYGFTLLLCLSRHNLVGVHRHFKHWNHLFHPLTSRGVPRPTVPTQSPALTTDCDSHHLANHSSTWRIKVDDLASLNHTSTANLLAVCIPNPLLSNRHRSDDLRWAGGMASLGLRGWLSIRGTKLRTAGISRSRTNKRTLSSQKCHDAGGSGDPGGWNGQACSRRPSNNVESQVQTGHGVGGLRTKS